MPIAISDKRMRELDDPNTSPTNSNEERLVRNRMAIKNLKEVLAQRSEVHLQAQAKECQIALQTQLDSEARAKEQLANLRATVLAPFYQRIEEDHDTIVQLQQEVFDLKAKYCNQSDFEQETTLIPGVVEEQALITDGTDEQALFAPVNDEQALIAHGTEEEESTHNGVDNLQLIADNAENQAPIVDAAEKQAPAADALEEQAVIANVASDRSLLHFSDAAANACSFTPKRKATAPPNSYGQEVRHVKSGRIYDRNLAHLAGIIFEQLRKPQPNDPIEACGRGPLSTLIQRPGDALDLAHKYLHTTTPDGVDPCWRRLYEDATLYLVSQLLHKQSLRAQPATNSAKRVKLTDGDGSGSWLQEIVGKLDQAIVVAGAPGRRDMIDSIFDTLDPIAQRSLRDQDSQPLVSGPLPRPMGSSFSITRPKKVMTFEAFQKYLSGNGSAVQPLVMQGVMEDWPAMELWDDLLYLKRHTMAGCRLVPVEIGKSYTELGWGQEIMSFNEFAERFLIPEDPPQTGYLAQYDIFQQIPTLRSDILIPDYCHTTPPAPTGAAARTNGLAKVQTLEEPLLNAWLGPKGTKSPLHTDPYHNTLCQVVGYKYVRLYPPEETENLYPMGVNEEGIEMGNTSQVDVFTVRHRGLVSAEIAAAREELRRKFPRFEQAKYEEALLGPGDCLYIPLGWWHYVESLTASISVSFWWN